MSHNLPWARRGPRKSSSPTIRGVQDSVGAALRRLGLGGRAELVVAFSGGVDSAALLWCLSERLGSRASKLEAVHVDHGLRPDSGEAALLAMEVVRGLGLRGRIVKVECGAGGDVEARARAARYAALGEAAAGRPVLTAHTGDDQAETVLYRLGRGSGTLGLGGIRDRIELHGAQIFRPFLRVHRRELEALVKEVNLPIVEDPTNHTDAFVRNRLRHEVLPRLEAAIPGGTVGLARAAMLAQADEAYLEERAREAAAELAAAEGLDVRRLASLPFPLATRIVRAELEAAGGAPPTLRQLEEYLALGGGDGAIHLAGGWVVENRRGALRIHRSGRRPGDEEPTADASK